MDFDLDDAPRVTDFYLTLVDYPEGGLHIEMLSRTRGHLAGFPAWDHADRDLRHVVYRNHGRMRCGDRGHARSPVSTIPSPSPLVGEGRGGGSGGCGTAVPRGTTPTPDPSPQGGGEKKGGRAICDRPTM